MLCMQGTNRMYPRLQTLQSRILNGFLASINFLLTWQSLSQKLLSKRILSDIKHLLHQARTRFRYLLTIQFFDQGIGLVAIELNASVALIERMDCFAK